jgi:hypothetical protein
MLGNALAEAIAWLAVVQFKASVIPGLTSLG